MYNSGHRHSGVRKELRFAGHQHLPQLLIQAANILKSQARGYFIDLRYELHS